MNILIYVEPIVFRGDPFLLRPWVDWISSMLRSNAGPGVMRKFFVCSNPTLCDLFKELPAGIIESTFQCDPVKLLDHFGFHRDQYSSDLFDTMGRRPFRNLALLESLESIKLRVEPHVVITFSENRYLKKAFFNSKVIYCELAPIPRLGSAKYLFTDPRGHQANSMLNVAARVPSPVEPDDVNRIFAERIDQAAERHPLAVRVSEWVGSVREGFNVALMALQPSDWITFEGGYESIAVDSLVMRWSTELPAGWIGIPTYYGSARLSSDMEAQLQKSLGNIRFAPPDLCSGVSELFIPHIDAVVTISSTTAMCALLYGKSAVTLGRTSFSDLGDRRVSELDSAKPMSPGARASVLAFVTNRYCHDLEDFQFKEHYFGTFLDRFNAAEDPEAFFTDMSDWSLERASRVLRYA